LEHAPAQVPQQASNAHVNMPRPFFGQTEKDARLVELLNLASTHGMTEIDPEAATCLLEGAEWDVMEALTRLRQEEWDMASRGDRGFQHSAVSTSRPLRPLPPRRMDRTRQPLPFFQPPVLSGGGGLGVVGHHNADVDDDDGDGYDDEWALDIQDWVNELMEVQGEADLEDAIRLSTEEAYSGGFSVPPVEEDTLVCATKTHTYVNVEGEPKVQCVICLNDLEHGDSLRSLQCNHTFHMLCVDQWLAQSGQCPTCKCRVGS